MHGMGSTSERHRHYEALLGDLGQRHLLAFWGELAETQKQQLLDDLDRIDFKRVTPALIDQMVRCKPPFHKPAKIDPPDAFPAKPDIRRIDEYRKARAAGEDAIRAGAVAAFTVAGGEGTRLGFNGPKGAFAISPIRNATLFQLFAEQLLGVRRRYGRQPHWYIMTSLGNHAATEAFFEQHEFFGLGRDNLTLFRQGQMPVFHPDGRIALAEKHRVALSPDGHGGSLRAIADSGALAQMRKHGVQHISYFQVDNPLVQAIDPLFIGLHATTGSQMSSKAVSKANDFERVGVFCRMDGRLGVIEYSDLPEELAVARNPDGSRRFDAGSIAIHALDRTFVEQVTTAGAAAQLPWHRAEKKVDVLDDAGRLVRPDKPNVVKLELFVFDAIPLARNPLVLFTRREEEFSPVKNADGADSPATTRQDLLRRAARWLESCGITVSRDASGNPATMLEISPAFALDAADLQTQLRQRPTLKPGETRLFA